MAGFCVNGDNRPAVAGAVCEECWFRRKGWGASGRRRHSGRIPWQQLRDLFYVQGGKCAYTGEPLVIGVNASLDHRVPISRGGTHTIENVQWVSMRINFMKTEMTHDEFIATCARVVTNNASGTMVRDLSYDGPSTAGTPMPGRYRQRSARAKLERVGEQVAQREPEKARPERELERGPHQGSASAHSGKTARPPRVSRYDETPGLPTGVEYGGAGSTSSTS